MSDLVSLVCAGDIRAAGRLISMIDRGEDSIEKYLPVLFPFTGNAFRIGITGPPGAGKSTLASAICRTYLDAGQSVGILAVDITSPFTGGALLGDRIRMGGLTQDARVFIRSIGNGGVPGGLSRSTRDAMRVLERRASLLLRRRARAHRCRPVRGEEVVAPRPRDIVPLVPCRAWWSLPAAEDSSADESPDNTMRLCSFFSKKSRNTDLGKIFSAHPAASAA